MNSLQYCESIYVLLKLILVIIVDDLEQKQQKNIKTIKQWKQKQQQRPAMLWSYVVLKLIPFKVICDFQQQQRQHQQQEQNKQQGQLAMLWRKMFSSSSYGD